MDSKTVTYRGSVYQVAHALFQPAENARLGPAHRGRRRLEFRSNFWGWVPSERSNMDTLDTIIASLPDARLSLGDRRAALLLSS
jgi:hypothetical protein